MLLFGMPPRPRQVGLLGDCRAHGPGVTSGENRLREHKSDSPVVWVGKPNRERQELGRRIGIGTTAVVARSTACRVCSHL